MISCRIHLLQAIVPYFIFRVCMLYNARIPQRKHFSTTASQFNHFAIRLIVQKSCTVSTSVTSLPTRWLVATAPLRPVYPPHLLPDRFPPPHVPADFVPFHDRRTDPAPRLDARLLPMLTPSLRARLLDTALPAKVPRNQAPLRAGNWLTGDMRAGIQNCKLLSTVGIPEPFPWVLNSYSHNVFMRWFFSTQPSR